MYFGLVFVIWKKICKTFQHKAKLRKKLKNIVKKLCYHLKLVEKYGIINKKEIRKFTKDAYK